MRNILREDIHLISRFSNLTEQDAKRILVNNVYNQKIAWQKFIRLFVISLGVSFTAAGIVFFFAYNWADLHKFVKIGLTQAILVATTIMAVLPKINENIRNIILTGASVLTGVSFAVFGQIYQTGANAYDFFLAWTIFVTIWVIVSNFWPLWLIYIALINSTLLLYAQQVANDWSEVYICFLLLIMNTAFLISSIFLYKKSPPTWFLNTVALICITYASIGNIIGLFDHAQKTFPILIIFSVFIFALGIWYGLKTKSGFFVSVIPFSIIVIASALLIKISDGKLMFLLISLFIIGSVTLTIKNLIDIQKKWTNEK